MKYVLTTIYFFLFYTYVTGQFMDSKWYSEHQKDGIIIQNSYPKGGRYPGPTTEHYNYSYLVFYSRLVNQTEQPVEVCIDFSVEAIGIPDSPNTFVKMFLPSDTMTQEKRELLSYGLKPLASLDKPTNYQCTIKPGGDCLFYSVALFYQTKEEAWQEERGGNRAEFIFDGKEIIFNMRPQINALSCGHITVVK